MTNLTNSRTLRILGIFSVALFALAVQTSPAAITVQPETATFMTNSGTIDVFVSLTNPELTTPPLLSSYNVAVDPVATTTGTITPADVVLSFNAAAFGNSVNKADVFPTFDVIDTSVATAPKTSGASATSPAVSLFNDAGLMSVNFTVTPGKVGTFNIDLDSALTKLFDHSFNEITGVGLSSGVITIVPEPSSLVASLLGISGLLGIRRRLF
jgi:hypothetical protein